MSRFDKYLASQRRLEAEIEANIAAKLNAGMPSVLEPVREGPSEEDIFDQQRRNYELVLIVIVFDATSVAFQYFMGNCMDATFKDQPLLADYLAPAMRKASDLAAIIVYASAAFAVWEGFKNLVAMYKSKSFNALKVVDVFIVAAWIALLIRWREERCMNSHTCVHIQDTS